MVGRTDCMNLATIMGGDPWLISCLSQVSVSAAVNTKRTRTSRPHSVLYRLSVCKLEAAPGSLPAGPRRLISLAHSPIFTTANGVPERARLLRALTGVIYTRRLYEALIIVIINATDSARQLCKIGYPLNEFIQRKNANLYNGE